MGSSFGAIASLSTAVRYPEMYGSLLLQSGSFVFTDIGERHGGGPAFDPVVQVREPLPAQADSGCASGCSCPAGSTSR